MTLPNNDGVDGIVVDFEVTEGPGDDNIGTAGHTSETPDMSCTTAGGATNHPASCTVEYITLGRELHRARRESGSVSLLMMDVDHFKAFNDRHGHLAGDEALQAVAQALEQANRGLDLVARYGGEEFAVILPGCPVEESLSVAERLRKAVAALAPTTPITVSVGISTFPDDGGDADALLKAADEALYASKHAGRDRVARPPGRGAPEPSAA